MSLISTFNWSYYDMLLTEDRKMIDEYINRMSVADINSFMQRLIEHYKTEEALEVNEDKDAIIVFERNRLLSQIDARNITIKQANINKISYEHALKYFIGNLEPIKKNKSMNYLTHTIYKYFENDYNKEIRKNINALTAAEYLYALDFNNYLGDFELQKKLFYNDKIKYKVGWSIDKNIDTHIHDLFVKYAQSQNKAVKRIDNVVLSAKLYTYRKDSMRLGIALDKNVLQNTLGYGHNFKISLASIKVINSDGHNISAHVKNAGYWKSNNAILHDFDSRTGIIWFNGSRLGKKQWQLPNNSVMKDGDKITLSLLYTTDAYSKMLNRFQFNKKMRNITSQLELNNIL